MRKEELQCRATLFSLLANPGKALICSATDKAKINNFHEYIKTLQDTGLKFIAELHNRKIELSNGSVLEFMSFDDKDNLLGREFKINDLEIYDESCEFDFKKYEKFKNLIKVRKR